MRCSFHPILNPCVFLVFVWVVLSGVLMWLWNMLVLLRMLNGCFVLNRCLQVFKSAWVSCRLSRSQARIKWWGLKRGNVSAKKLVFILVVVGLVIGKKPLRFKILVHVPWFLQLCVFTLTWVYFQYLLVMESWEYLCTRVFEKHHSCLHKSCTVLNFYLQNHEF